jgi:glycine cleavage system transcriptional repressor
MKNWYMLTVVGQDRAGIVATLTDALYRGGANLGEASMVRLGGNFTIMLMVQSQGDAEGLEKMLAPVTQTLGVRVHIDPIQGQLHEHVIPNARITVHGADRPGIVAQVTAALAAHGFNILDLDSDVGGTVAQPIYIMVLEGYAGQGVEALEHAVAPLRTGGIELNVTPIDTLVG